ncbi:hypothetical protein ABEB36_002559 [Hypothenemus hampei]|uniref:Translation initiation factor IF-3, mitochondrial n=1 Tax=Hypothenemus hampei TaxID=57062 RepID=A0ABD1F670_HYPHA
MFANRIKNCLQKTWLKYPATDIAKLTVNSLFLSYNSLLVQNKTNIAAENPKSVAEFPRKKTTPIPKITLLSGEDISLSTLEEAQKIAKRRDLKLVKILDLDTKTQRPVYKLMSGAEYHAEDLKQRERKKLEKQNNQVKGEKVLIVGQNISEHDLNVHINKISKWLAKKYEVRMIINGNIENMSKAEEVYAFLEKSITGIGRMVQKRQKGSDIKFQVIPPKESKQTKDGENDNNGKNESPL